MSKKIYVNAGHESQVKLSVEIAWSELEKNSDASPKPHTSKRQLERATRLRKNQNGNQNSTTTSKWKVTEADEL